ncbi:MAG: PKD domain-containing protein [Crocinitomix sp.]|nr:PKD domain-containing protein [Crocinitomix sp.]
MDYSPDMLCEKDCFIIIRDENGCEFEITVTLNEPEVLDVSEFLTDEVCEGDCNGAIDLFIDGGVSPYTFSIDDCVTLETFAAFTDLCPANYMVCVEDANGCRFNNTVTINAGLAPVDPTMIPIGPFCADASPILIIAPDLGDLTGPGVVGGSFDPAVAGPGVHTITNTIVNDCGGGIATMEVIVNPLPNVVLLANETTGCIPFEVFFENVGETGVTCEWNFGDGTIVETCDFIMHTYTNPGVYDVSLTVIDANGCSATAFYEDYIAAYDLPIANFKYAPVEVTTLDRTVDFTDLSSGADNWIWNFDAFGNSTDQNPSFLFPDNEGTYEIMQIAITPEGCRDTMVQTLVVVQEHLIFVPNVITPDGTNLNEVFLPYFTGIDVYNYHLTIYNRWGELVFESYDLNTGWNGTFNDVIVQDGVYIWHILVGDIDTEFMREYHGHVSVLR